MSSPKKRQKTPARRPRAGGKKAKGAKKARSAKGSGRGPGRPFAPGNAGGPGRPKIPRDYKVAMENLGPRGLQAVSDIIADSAHPRHAEVAMYAVNRWKGTPKARTEISGPEGGPVPVKSITTSGAKRARVAELLARASARVAAAKGPGATAGTD